MDRQDINFKPIEIHPEEEPVLSELNDSIKLINKDLTYIDKSLIEASINFDNLLKNSKLKLLNIKEIINAERERQEDINILCNKYSDFTSVLNLNKEDFGGTLNFEDGIIQSNISKTNKINFSITSVDGNGFKGNQYVYLNDSFIDKLINTKDSKNINDNNIATSFEYSRLTINNETEAPVAFNKDSLEAECSIAISSEKEFNHIELNSERDDIILKEIYTSIDGLTYSLDKEYNISINSRREMYNDNEYIYGSGIITVEPTKFIKIVLRSNGYTDDQLAYIKTFYDETSSKEVAKKIIKVDSARRHVIQINEISLLSNSYSKGMLTSKELITSPVKCISLYCNEYINKDYTIEKNVSYYLVINGQEHKIDPVNSHRNGKKVIRTSSQLYKSEHVIYLNEEIKSAKLKIVINSTNKDITPYISDVKILIGGV